MYKQKGIVLVMTLVLLMALTLIAVVGMRTMILQEQLAGNMRNQSIAFQAAEAALKDAERLLESGQVVTTDGTPTDGLLGPNEDEFDIFSADLWYTQSIPLDNKTNEPASLETNTMAVFQELINENQMFGFPMYIIKQVTTSPIGLIGDLPDSVSGAMDGGVGGASQTAKEVQANIYRITAYGMGGTEHARAILQETYAY